MIIPKFYHPNHKLNCGFHRSSPDNIYHFFSLCPQDDWKTWKSETVEDCKPKRPRSNNNNNLNDLSTDVANFPVSWRDLHYFLVPRLRITPFLFSLVKKRFFAEAVREHRFPTLREIETFWFSTVTVIDRTEFHFRLLCHSEESSFLLPSDLEPLLQQIVSNNDSLFFLRTDAKHIQLYVDTVTLRIFFLVNTSRTGKISLREFRQSSLVKVLSKLRNETCLIDDSEPYYFSYAFVQAIRMHYCYFRTVCLEKDPTLILENVPTEFLKKCYPNLSSSILERLTQVALKALTDGQTMASSKVFTYADFVYLFLAEKDITTKASIQFWFDVLDIEGNGLLDLHRTFLSFYDRDMNYILQYKAITEDRDEEEQAAAEEADNVAQRVLIDIRHTLFPQLMHRMNLQSTQFDVMSKNLVMQEFIWNNPSFRMEFSSLVHLLTQPENAYHWFRTSESDFGVSVHRRQMLTSAKETRKAADYAVDFVCYIINEYVAATVIS